LHAVFILYSYRGGLFPNISLSKRPSPFTVNNVKDNKSVEKVKSPVTSKFVVPPMKQYGEIPDKDYVKDRQDFMNKSLVNATSYLSKETTSSRSSSPLSLKSRNEVSGERTQQVDTKLGASVQQTGRRKPVLKLKRPSKAEEDDGGL
jgi:hypothetical protein